MAHQVSQRMKSLLLTGIQVLRSRGWHRSSGLRGLLARKAYKVLQGRLAPPAPLVPRDLLALLEVRALKASRVQRGLRVQRGQIVSSPDLQVPQDQPAPLVRQEPQV